MSNFTSAAKAAFAASAAQASASALASGTLEILDASGTVLSSHGLGSPSASGAQTIMSGFPKSGAAIASGVAASARYRKADSSDWVTGMSVGTSGSEVVLSALSITAGQTVTINSASLNHTAN